MPGLFGRTAKSAFIPTDIAGCVIWFRSDLGITKDGGNLVSQWADQSGNNHHIAQALDAKKPIWTTNEINGHAGLIFDGINDMLVSADSFAWAKPNTVYVVFKPITYGGSDFIYDATGVPDAGMGLFMFPAEPQYALHDGVTLIMGDTLAPGVWGIITGIHNGASSSIRLNANAATTGNAGANASGGFTLARISNTDSLYGNMSIVEVIGYGSVSAGDDALILDYLNTRYGIY